MTSFIVHPLFAECSQYTLDPFWKEKFENFSFNKFPNGVRYDAQHQNLILKLPGKKTEVVALPYEDIPRTFQIIMGVLKEKLGLMSNRDIKINKEALKEDKQNNTTDLDCEWKKIKPRGLKDQLMSDYILYLRSKYSLTSAETRQLTSVIQLGFQFKAFSQDDVIFKRGKVKGIQGLVFNKETRKFESPEYIKCSSKATTKNTNPEKFYSMVKKFMKENSLRTTKFI
jgi:hypothetical protein